MNTQDSLFKKILPIAFVLLFAGLQVQAQIPSADWYGKVSIGNPMTVHSNVTLHPNSELFLNANATNSLSIAGNYCGQSSAKVYLSATNSENHNFLYLSGSATGATELRVDLSNEWDGTDIDLVKAHRENSESTAFSLQPIDFQGGTARLSYREEETNIVWYLAKSLPLIKQLGNHTLLANNNSETNGGHQFGYYYWYKDGELIYHGSHDEYGGSYYTGGANLDAEAKYEVEAVDNVGKHYFSCPYRYIPSLVTTQVKAYPNPVGANDNYQVTVEVETDNQWLLDTAVVEIYSSTGQYIGTMSMQGKRAITIYMPQTAGLYLLKFRSDNGEKELKIIVQ